MPIENTARSDQYKAKLESAHLKGKIAFKQARRDAKTSEVPPTYDTVRATATAVTKALSEMGVACALYGGLANKLYGSDCNPEAGCSQSCG